MEARPPARRGLRLVPWALTALAVLLPAALLLPRFWEGKDTLGPVILLLGAVLLAGTTWAVAVLVLVVARALRRHARAVVLTGAIVLSWAALIPLGLLVEQRSIAESKRRVEAIADAAERYRAREGFYPADVAELRRTTGLALPSPSWGTGFAMRMEEGRLVLRFWAPIMIDDHGWSFDSASRSWQRWSG